MENHINKYVYKLYMNIFIFRRDLRLVDNVGLNYAMNNFKNIVPIFIFTPEQITNKNKYKSDNSVQFMIESLKELDSELKKNKSKLHLFYGDNIKVLTKICNKINVDNIVFNMDYTPYAIKRDKQIQTFCNIHSSNHTGTYIFLGTAECCDKPISHCQLGNICIGKRC